MAKLLNIFLLLLSSLYVCSAHADDTQVKEWTYLIYMPNGNNLQDSLQKNITELETVGSNDQMNIVVQLGSTSSSKSYRFFIKKNNEASDKIKDIPVEKLGKIDTGDFKEFKRFIAWAVKKYPARHYFIEISGHGAPASVDIDPPAEPTALALKMPGLNHIMNLAIGFDKITNNYISNKELAEALRYAKTLIGHNVDIYGSDACEMGQLEVAAEMADSVDFFIGSQDTTPDNGWNYAAILTEWQSMTNPTTAEIASLVIKHNKEFYLNARETGKDISDDDLKDLKTKGYTIAAYDLSKLPLITHAMKVLSDDLLTLNDDDCERLIETEKRALYFTDKYNTDLTDFLNRLDGLQLPNANIAQHIADIKTAQNQMVIANGGFGAMLQPSGVSFMYPLTWEKSIKDYVTGDYQHLMFDQETRWSDAINWIWRGVSPE